MGKDEGGARTGVAPGMHDPEDLGLLVNRLARAMRTLLAQELEEIGLTPSQAALLLALPSEEGLTLSELAGAIDSDRATMSGLVERLERDGWIEVGPNPRDGRSRLVSASEKARRVLPRVRTAAAAVSARSLASLDARERRDVTRLLGRMLSALGEVRS